MTGLKVKIQNEKRQYETVTDHDGRYRVRGVPAGKYIVSVFLPEGYASLHKVYGARSKTEFSTKACGAEENFETRIDSRISGRVFDAGGKPVDRVQVSIVTLESSTKGMSLIENFSDSTEKDGSYEFDGLQPGKYLLGVSIADPPDSDTPYTTLYYPQSSDRAQAQVFELSFGQKLKDIDFRLSSKLTEMTISGVVVDSSGKPVINARVDIHDEEDLTARLALSSQLRTDTQGRFTVRCFKGRRYRLHAWKEQDYLAGTGEQSELMSVDTNGPPVTLILNQPGIFIKR